VKRNLVAVERPASSGNERQEKTQFLDKKSIQGDALHSAEADTLIRPETDRSIHSKFRSVVRIPRRENFLRHPPCLNLRPRDAILIRSQLQGIRGIFSGCGI